MTAKKRRKPKPLKVPRVKLPAVKLNIKVPDAKKVKPPTVGGLSSPVQRKQV